MQKDKVKVRRIAIFDTGLGSITQLECVDYPGIRITEGQGERLITYNEQAYQTINDAVKAWETDKSTTCVS